MVRVTVDIIPFGIEEDKITVHEITIANTGKTNKNNEHEYTYQICDKTGAVYHHRDKGLLNLVRAVINSITSNGKKIPQNFEGA